MSALPACPHSSELDEALLRLVRASLHASLALRRVDWHRLPVDLRAELDDLVRAAEAYSETFCAVTGDRPDPMSRSAHRMGGR